MKKYKYIGASKLENYDGWEIFKVIEAQPPSINDMVIIMKED